MVRFKDTLEGKPITFGLLVTPFFSWIPFVAIQKYLFGLKEK